MDITGHTYLPVRHWWPGVGILSPFQISLVLKSILLKSPQATHLHSTQRFSSTWLHIPSCLISPLITSELLWLSPKLDQLGHEATIRHRLSMPTSPYGVIQAKWHARSSPYQGTLLSKKVLIYPHSSVYKTLTCIEISFKKDQHFLWLLSGEIVWQQK